jgi:outer membrane protein assembly factor BamB
MTATSPEVPSGTDRGLGNPVAALGRVLGVTEGRAYTIVIGLVVASLLAVFGIPQTLGHVTPVTAPARPPGPAVAPPKAAAPPAATVAAAPAAPAASPSLSFSQPATSTSDTFSSSPSASDEPVDQAVSVVPFGTTTLFAAVGAPGAPEGVAVAKDGTVFVGTDNGSKRGQPAASHLLAFGADGKLAHDFAITGQASGHAEGLTGVAVDPAGGVVVADLGTTPPRLLRIDPANGAQSAVADVPDLPACVLVINASACEPLALDNKPRPTSLAFDAAGNLYVGDAAQATIWRLDAGTKVLKPWYQSNDLATADGAAGLLIDGDGNLLFTAGTTLDTGNPAAGSLFKVPVTPTGAAGTRSLVAKFANGEAPSGVALGPGGTIVVALRAANAIAVVAADGTMTRVVNPNNGPIPFDAPIGLALRDNAVLVTNQSAANDATHWSVLSVSVAKSSF